MKIIFDSKDEKIEAMQTVRDASPASNMQRFTTMLEDGEVVFTGERHQGAMAGKVNEPKTETTEVKPSGSGKLLG